MTTTDALPSFISSKESSYAISVEKSEGKNDKVDTKTHKPNDKAAENIAIEALKMLQYEKSKRMKEKVSKSPLNCSKVIESIVETKKENLH